jgi:uroporphyrinogen-III synthase
MFQINSIDWSAPEPDGLSALMLTSAIAAARAGPALTRYRHLLCYCVGEATASAARQAGLQKVVTGAGDGGALLQLMATEGVTGVLHLCGREHIDLHHPDVWIERRVVYAADPVPQLSPDAIVALGSGALVLIHSPRAGRTFADLADGAGIGRGTIGVVAISPAAAAALGPGWRAVHAARRPDDHALLELAAKLCQEAGTVGRDRSG